MLGQLLARSQGKTSNHTHMTRPTHSVAVATGREGGGTPGQLLPTAAAAGIFCRKSQVAMVTNAFFFFFFVNTAF